MNNQHKGLAALMWLWRLFSQDWLYTALFGECDKITVLGGVAAGDKQ